MMAAAAAEMSEPLLRRLQNLSPLFNWVGPSLGRGISLNAIWTLPSSLLHGVGDVRWADGELRRRAPVPWRARSSARSGGRWRSRRRTRRSPTCCATCRRCCSRCCSKFAAAGGQGDMPHARARARRRCARSRRRCSSTSTSGACCSSACSCARRSPPASAAARCGTGAERRRRPPLEHIASDCAREHGDRQRLHAVVGAAPAGHRAALLWRALGRRPSAASGSWWRWCRCNCSSRARSRASARTAAATTRGCGTPSDAAREPRRPAPRVGGAAPTTSRRAARRAPAAAARIARHPQHDARRSRRRSSRPAPSPPSPGGALHASTVFSSIALFNALRAPLGRPTSSPPSRTPASRSRGCRRCSARRGADGEEEDVDGEGGAPYEPPTVPAPTSSARPARFSRGLRRRRRRRRRNGRRRRATRRRAAAAYRALPAAAGRVLDRHRRGRAARRRLPSRPPSRRPPWRRRCGWAAGWACGAASCW